MNEPPVDGQSPPERIFISRVDEGGKVALPPVIIKFLSEFADNRLFMTSLDRQSIGIWPIALWRKNEEFFRTRNLTEEIASPARRIAFNAADLGAEVEIDDIGRIFIPLELRRELGLDDNELMIGVRKQRVEIYRHPVYARLSDATRKEIEDRIAELFRLYFAPELTDPGPQNAATQSVLLNIDESVLKFLAKHPEYTYQMSSRKFEELVARIMEDLGFDVKLTPATRDGGRDIIALLRNTVSTVLFFVECKKYAAKHPVGVGVITAVYGVQRIHKANKSIIVTTSHFTGPAKAEHKRIESEMDLKDYEDLKIWFARYDSDY